MAELTRKKIKKLSRNILLPFSFLAFTYVGIAQENNVVYSNFSSTPLVSIIETKDTVESGTYYEAKVFLPKIKLGDPQNKVEFLLIGSIPIKPINDTFLIKFSVPRIFQNDALRSWNCKISIQTPSINKILYLKEEYYIKKDTAKPIQIDYNLMPEKPASFPGGEEKFKLYLEKNLRNYVPKENGRVFVNFFIMPDGKIENVKIVKGINQEIDALVLKLIENMPKWIPAEDKGKKVKTLRSLPILFNNKK